MAREKRIIKQSQVGNEGTVDTTGVDYHPSFPTRLGMAAMINQAIDNVSKDTQRTKGVNPIEVLKMQRDNASTTLGKAWVQNVQKNMQTGSLDFSILSAWSSSLGVDINTVLVNNLSTAIASLSSKEENNEIKASAVPPLQKIVDNGATSAEINLIERQIINDIGFKEYLNSIQKQQTVKFQSPSRRIIISQMEIDQTQDMSNPLTSGQFKSMEELKTTLMQMGPKPELYNRIFELVGKDNEDSSKSALSKFFQGSPAGLCILYDMLIKAGAASPVDESIIGGLMESHPEIFPEEEKKVEASLSKNSINGSYVLEAEGKTVTIKNSWDLSFLAQKLGWDGQNDPVAYIESKVGQRIVVAGIFGKNYQKVVSAMNGLFLTPQPDASLHTMQKVASGGVGSTVNMVYDLAGPSDKRYCPKIRNVISTFQCRYNCLDGLAIGDAQILCGEAIYRQAVMDKFSTEYLNKDGKLEGGYLRERFQIEQTTHEHPTLLKPGQRMQPINEDAWSTEKRLQELRREEGKKRGYSETPGDPKDLYNFDQHEIVKGPQAPNLFGTSGRTKTASFNLKEIKTAQTERPEKKTIPLFDDYFMVKDVDVSGNDDIRIFKGDKKDYLAPQVVGMVMQGKLSFYKHVPQEIRKLISDAVKNALKPQVQAFNLKQQKTAGPMTPPKVQAGTICPRCNKPGKEGQTQCMTCGGPMKVQPMNDALERANALPKQELKAYIANGVFKVTSGEVCAYGSTLKEAMRKLHAQVDELVPEDTDPLQEEEQILTDYIQEEDDQQEYQIGPDGQPILGPDGQPLLVQNPQNQSNSQLDQSQELSIVPEGTEGKAAEQKNKKDIALQALDSYLDVTEAKTPEKKKELLEGIHPNAGFGPD